LSWALIATCAVLPAASLAGCGGSSSGNSTGRGDASRQPQQQSGSSYIEGSEALCRSLKKKAVPIRRELAELHGSIKGKAQEAKAIAALKEYVALGREEETDLRELGTPPGDAGITGRSTAVAREGLDKLEEAIEALEEGENSKFEDRSKEGSELLFESHRIARKHGSRNCGEGQRDPI
jgi:hypothetical protein